MVNHVIHKEKAKKEMMILIKKLKDPNFGMTDLQIDQQMDLILHHMYRFIFNKLSKSRAFDSENQQQDNKIPKKEQSNIPQIGSNDLNF